MQRVLLLGAAFTALALVGVPRYQGMNERMERIEEQNAGIPERERAMQRDLDRIGQDLQQAREELATATATGAEDRRDAERTRTALLEELSRVQRDLATAEEQVENYRKLLLSIAKDARVIIIKLADRLHNMRTIRSMKVEKQGQKARETMDIYAPLAGRMGMQWMREELEDLAFRVLNPEGRNSIIRRFITLQRETGDMIQQITSDIELELE